MKKRVLRVVVSVAPLFVCLATEAAESWNGRDIAANCANCHGTNGRSLAPMPSLAGRPQGEIALFVKEFRDGKRPGTVMPQLAKGYTDAQIDAVAAYLTAQKP
jgi:cytochrome subunit of sulfide dehydrogenase